jgi:MoCo/4Fe-4S cofactor protein with predicted Tat translocation signal
MEMIRARLAGVRGQQYWRSLEEVAETPEFLEMLHREFPDGSTEWIDGVSRRSFIKMAAASLALAGVTACTKQRPREILPYVKQPEGLVPGEALVYATTMTRSGYATGVIARSREGHPIKVDGNPDHPASLGGSNIWMQASILDLYDPDRSQNILHKGQIATWADLVSDLNAALREHQARDGAGLYFLTETITSPTVAELFELLFNKFPNAKLYQFDSISRDFVREGARLAYGEILEAQYRFDRAAVILSLESDFLYSHPLHLRHARQFTDGRRVSAGKSEMNRLYVVESTPTVTGTMADHRLPLASAQIQHLALEIARGTGALAQNGGGLEIRNPKLDQWLGRLIRDLKMHQGQSIVIAGEWQPPIVHALAHLLNDKFGNTGKTVFYTEPVEFRPSNQLDSLRQLSKEANAGEIQTLFILGGNPGYSVPADLEFSKLLQNVSRTFHLGIELDETAALSTWHIPQAHYLESWGDAKSLDGTVSLQQPLIEPLYGGKTIYQLLDTLLLRQPVRSDYEVVRDHWTGMKLWHAFEKSWRQALSDGFIANSSAPEKRVTIDTDNIQGALGNLQKEQTPAAPGREEPTQVELTFRPDPSVWDGRFANNGWLQECARPVSKLTWDNAAFMSPVIAQRHRLTTGDMVELELNGRKSRVPVWIQPGQAENTVTVHLGYGRQRVGRVGDNVGFNVSPLRASDAFWSARGLKILKLSGRHELVATQTHHNLQSPERQIYREGTLEQFRSNSGFVKESIELPAENQTLYDPRDSKYDGSRWGMSIDLNTCIGCNACLVACNAENNIPVVGKDQVSRNREMYWIRIDTYYKGPLDDPEFSHMPVPCMHCEHAPCELVCPVAATVHDHEGLNLQIYNRCVGTRFCSNNCPYKVRRFNFLWYSDYRTPNLKPMYNPEVTVRWRGVMEKCTYCIQRISHGRIAARKDNRSIRDGEIKTACQQACPANAIIFGDLNLADSQVGKLKQHPLDYSMLAQLNTRPRTTYLAKLRNPNQETLPGISA